MSLAYRVLIVARPPDGPDQPVPGADSNDGVQENTRVFYRWVVPSDDHVKLRSMLVCEHRQKVFNARGKIIQVCTPWCTEPAIKAHKAPPLRPAACAIS